MSTSRRKISWSSSSRWYINSKKRIRKPTPQSCRRLQYMKQSMQWSEKFFTLEALELSPAVPRKPRRNWWYGKWNMRYLCTKWGGISGWRTKTLAGRAGVSLIYGVMDIQASADIEQADKLMDIYCVTLQVVASVGIESGDNRMSEQRLSYNGSHQVQQNWKNFTEEHIRFFFIIIGISCLLCKDGLLEHETLLNSDLAKFGNLVSKTYYSNDKTVKSFLGLTVFCLRNSWILSYIRSYKKYSP